MVRLCDFQSFLKKKRVWGFSVWKNRVLNLKGESPFRFKTRFFQTEKPQTRFFFQKNFESHTVPKELKEACKILFPSLKITGGPLHSAEKIQSDNSVSPLHLQA